MNNSLDYVGIYLNDGTGVFAFDKELGVGDSPAGLLVTDLNGDGKPDIAVGSYMYSTIMLLLHK